MNRPPNDRFYGGPLDGQEQPATYELQESRYDPATGALYLRNMQADGDKYRAWQYAQDRDPLDSIAVTRSTKDTAVTLKQLDELVATAKQFGYPPEAEPTVLVTLRGKLKTIGFQRHEKPKI